MGHDHGAAIYTLPASVTGAEWIRPLDAKAFTGATLLSFTLTKDADIFIAHDHAMQTKPSWLTGWTNTGENIILGNGTTRFSAPFTMRLYKKSFLAGQLVELGPNGGASQHLMYFTIIKATSSTPPNEVSLVVSDANAADAGLDTAVFSVVQSAGSTGAITVNYTVGGTATSGSDFNALPGSVTIPDGQSSVNITLTPIDDALLESDETVTLALQAGAGSHGDIACARLRRRLERRCVWPIERCHARSNRMQAYNKKSERRRKTTGALDRQMRNALLGGFFLRLELTHASAEFSELAAHFPEFAQNGGIHVGLAVGLGLVGFPVGLPLGLAGLCLRLGCLKGGRHPVGLRTRFGGVFGEACGSQMLGRLPQVADFGDFTLACIRPPGRFHIGPHHRWLRGGCVWPHR